MGVRRSVKVSAGYCSDSDVMVTAVAASALLEGGACEAPGRARHSRVGDGVWRRDPVAPVAFPCDACEFAV